LEINAGHGLNYENVRPILALPGLVELNIGHSLVSEAIMSGLGPAVRRMKDLLVL
jgi:pyridoxine 5-phosphate synthase